MTREDLIKELDGQLMCLSKKWKIDGYTQKDLYNQLIVKLLEDYKEHGQDDTKKKGWWFLRLKWYCQHLSKKSKREPLSRTINISDFL